MCNSFKEALVSSAVPSSALRKWCLSQMKNESILGKVVTGIWGWSSINLCSFSKIILFSSCFWLVFHSFQWSLPCNPVICRVTLYWEVAVFLIHIYNTDNWWSFVMGKQNKQNKNLTNPSIMKKASQGAFPKRIILTSMVRLNYSSLTHHHLLHCRD